MPPAKPCTLYRMVQKNNKIRGIEIAISAVPWFILCLSFVWLFFQRYPLSGASPVESRMDGKSQWMNPFLPAERVTRPGSQQGEWVGQRILADPVYATALTPGGYETVDVTLEYRVTNQPFVEFGIVRDEAGKNVELQPMYSAQLEAEEWNPVMIDRKRGYARSRVALLGTEDSQRFAAWHATTSMPLLADPAGDGVNTPVSLRGAHDFYFVPAGGIVSARFTLQNSNRLRQKSAVAFRVFHGDTEVRYDGLGWSGGGRGMGPLFTHEITFPRALPGVYRVSFVADDNMFIRNIWTTSKRWVVGPRVYQGDVIGHAASPSPAQFWTKALHLIAQTFHAEGLQAVAFGDREFTLTRTHRIERVDRMDHTEHPANVFAPRGDVRFVLAGFAAFREDAYFDPTPLRLTDATNLSVEKINAVVTSYQRPKHLAGGWLRSSFRFKLDPYAEALRFVLSAPGIEGRTGWIDLRNARLTYRRKNENVRDWMRALRRDILSAVRR